MQFRFPAPFLEEARALFRHDKAMMLALMKGDVEIVRRKLAAEDQVVQTPEYVIAMIDAEQVTQLRTQNLRLARQRRLWNQLCELVGEDPSLEVGG